MPASLQQQPAAELAAPQAQQPAAGHQPTTSASSTRHAPALTQNSHDELALVAAPGAPWR
jgi:hypothetical protein